MCFVLFNAFVYCGYLPLWVVISLLLGLLWALIWVFCCLVWVFAGCLCCWFVLLVWFVMFYLWTDFNVVSGCVI